MLKVAGFYQLFAIVFICIVLFLVHYLLTAVNRDFMADNSTRWLKKSCVAEFLTGVGKI